ncbi:tRNA lysidine(34) synthetase [Bacillus safensis]|uniref:asparagine synthase-related protein n=1 Tax=Bacillus safensis TaxID=561879 RepID=UPI0012446E38|nr:asparagine synthase-related protein [Bacillus safensis]
MKKTVDYKKNSNKILLKDRLDRKFYIEAKPNELFSSILNRNHIPLDAVIVRRNGEVIDDWLMRYSPKDNYIIEMVRAYHLPDFLSLLRLWDTNIYQQPIKADDQAYYTRRHFLHDSQNGDYKSTQSTFNKQDFVAYIENLFADGVKRETLIDENEHISLAISGGRDSLALGYLLNNTKESLPSFSVTSIHVSTFSKEKETSFAAEIAQKFGYSHRNISDSEVRNVFNFKIPTYEVMEKVKYDYNKAYSIGTAHAIMRGVVEYYSKVNGINKIAFGLMCEDIVTSILKSKFIGSPFLGPFKRKWGEFELIYPLWSITKKELTLYLEAIVPEHNTQGSPTQFDRGALDRDIYYLLADTLTTIFPGSAYQLFKGHQKETEYHNISLDYKQCENCQSTFNDSYKVDSNMHVDDSLCDLCKLLEKMNLIK